MNLLKRPRSAKQAEPPADEVMLARYRQAVEDMVRELHGHDETLRHLSATDDPAQAADRSRLYDMLKVLRKQVQRFDFIDGGRWQRLLDELDKRAGTTRH